MTPPPLPRLPLLQVLILLILFPPGAKSFVVCRVSTRLKYCVYDDEQSQCTTGGLASLTTGAIKCVAQCPVGRFSRSLPHEGEFVKVCVLCAKGRFQAGIGAAAESACLECAAGRFNVNSGAEDCVECAGGKYGTLTAQTTENNSW